MKRWKISLYGSTDRKIGEVGAESREAAARIFAKKRGLDPTELCVERIHERVKHRCRECGWEYKGAAPIRWSSKGEEIELEPGHVVTDSLCSLCTQERVVGQRARDFMNQKKKLDQMKARRAELVRQAKED